MPVACTSHNAVLLNGSVFVGGGHEGKSVNNYNNSYNLYVYNLSINFWSFITIPQSLYGMALVNERCKSRQ